MVENCSANAKAMGSIACSRRSDSGERCEVKGARKNKSEGGGEVREGGFPHLSPQSPSTFHRFLYFAPLSTIWTLWTGYGFESRWSPTSPLNKRRGPDIIKIQTLILFLDTENNNAVIKKILCRVQLSNKRRPRISTAFERWKIE